MREREWAIAVLLAAITFAIYWPVHQFDLVYFDDPLMLNECPQVQAGLAWNSIKWAFTDVVIANWNPLTSLSFLVVSQFYGIAPGAHHLANAVIHAANAALLFLLFRRLTGATWRSAAAAALFAWHPLRVESVAWIIERKDVLCGFFFLLALGFYGRFAVTTRESGHNEEAAGGRDSTAHKESRLLPLNRVPHSLNRPSGICSSTGEKAGIRGAGSWRGNWFYGASLLAFALALLSKPMAVTLPLVLLLLDFWPLRRIQNFPFQITGWKQLTLEKWPFFILMVSGCVATFLFQHNNAATTPWSMLGLSPRVANAVAGYIAYPAQMLWPVNLAVIYPYPKSFDPLETGLKAALLVILTAGCVMQIKRRPQLAFGWFWYLITALPIIGIVQVGEQARADRYTYLPLIGLAIALVWTLAEIFSRLRGGKTIFAASMGLILFALITLTERQLSFWRNTITLFSHNIEVTPDNGSAHFTLGLGFEHAGDTNRAITCYRVAKLLSPADPDPRRNLANLLMKQGHLVAAENEYAGLIALSPDNCSYRLCLAGTLTAEGREADAIAQLEGGLRLNPDSTEALNNLAWILATSSSRELRDGSRAVTLARHACELAKYQKTVYIGTLGAAYAEAGQFDAAMATAQKACDLAEKNGETNLFEANQKLSERYHEHLTARNQ